MYILHTLRAIPEIRQKPHSVSKDTVPPPPRLGGNRKDGRAQDPISSSAGHNGAGPQRRSRFPHMTDKLRLCSRDWQTVNVFFFFLSFLNKFTLSIRTGRLIEPNGTLVGPDGKVRGKRVAGRYGVRSLLERIAIRN